MAQCCQQKSWGRSGCQLGLSSSDREDLYIVHHFSSLPPPFLTPSLLLTLSFPDIFLRVRDNETLTVWWLPILFCQVNPVYKWSVTISFTKKILFSKKVVGTHTVSPPRVVCYNKYIPPSPTPVSFIFLLVTVIDQIFPDLLHLDWKYCFSSSKVPFILFLKQGNVVK